MNWRELLKNKKLLVGIGLAAAVGLGVMLQRRKATGSSSSDALSGGSSALGNVDTAGTDIASWLGSYSQSLQSMQTQQNSALAATLAGYGQNQQQALDELAQLIKIEQGSNTTSPVDLQTVHVNGGEWLKNILDKYKVSQSQLFASNPGLDSQLAWANTNGFISATNPMTTSATQVFGGGADIKVPK
jgi:hypothetical protein